MSMNPSAHPWPTSAEEMAEACEFDAFAQGQDPLDIEAATWVARRRNGLDAPGEAELQDWLDADPRHVAAFEDLDDTFGEVRQLPDENVAALKAHLSECAECAQSLPPIPARPHVERLPTTPGGSLARPVNPGRRRWLPDLSSLIPRFAVAAVALVIVGGSWLGGDPKRQQPGFEQTYITQRGQQLVVDLPDAAVESGRNGSRLHLDTATRVDARLHHDRRELRLQDGQTLFAVHADTKRPFHVWAGSLRITVMGTRFTVRHTASGLAAGQTVVSVEEGRVRVTRVDRPASASELAAPDEPIGGEMIELTAGQKLVADTVGSFGPVERISPHAIAAWRDGRISFDQIPLGEALAEFERYGRTGLVVRDPAVAALTVGGSYSLKQFQRFAETLPQVLPVRLVRRGDVTEVMARQDQ